MDADDGERLRVPGGGLGGEAFLPVAAWLAGHAALAYEGFARIARRLEAAGFERVLFFRAGGTHAYLARGRSDTGRPIWVLAFRGTEADYNDILVDVTFFRRTADYAEQYRTHGGFLTSLQGVWGSWGPPEALDDITIDAELRGPPGISEALSEELSPGDRLFVTGHSLGGALANLAAYYIDRDFGRRVTLLCTFGAPRVLDARMAASVDGDAPFSAWRFVNGADIVTRVPPRLFGFRHAGTKCYLGRDGELHRAAEFGDRLRDIGWLRALYFVVVFALAFVLAAAVLGPGWARGGLLYWSAAGAAGVIVAIAGLAFFAKAVPYLPGRISRWLRLREFLDHRIGAYREKLNRIAGAREGS